MVSGLDIVLAAQRAGRPAAGDMRCDVLAVGTELLLGQIVDTNSAWIGEQLAAAGIDSYLHVQVGDNQARVVETLRSLLDEADAVIVCGGLGPTQDDITREAIAEVMGAALERRDDLADAIREMFMSRGRAMPASNLRQADVPKGGEAIPNPNGTAPGLPVPGRATRSSTPSPAYPTRCGTWWPRPSCPTCWSGRGSGATILSRSLKTWGTSESALSERISARVDTQTNPTIAFLARGIEGLIVRISAKAPTADEAQALIAAEERILRDLLGDLVFAVDDETMESVVSDLLRAEGWTLGLAESLTGGLVGSRISDAPGSSEIFRGSIVSYATEVKRSRARGDRRERRQRRVRHPDGRGRPPGARRRRRPRRHRRGRARPNRRASRSAPCSSAWPCRARRRRPSTPACRATGS